MSTAVPCLHVSSAAQPAGLSSFTGKLRVDRNRTALSVCVSRITYHVTPHPPRSKDPRSDRRRVAGLSCPGTQPSAVTAFVLLQCGGAVQRGFQNISDHPLKQARMCCRLPVKAFSLVTHHKYSGTQCVSSQTKNRRIHAQCRGAKN